MTSLRADPWAPEYGMGFAARTEEPYSVADTQVETDDWTNAITPAAVSHGPVWFVDGVRRVDLRLLGRDGDATAPGIFGSYAVGSVRCDERAAFGEHRVGRALVIGGGLQAQPAEVRSGAALLRYQGVSEPRSDPDAPLDRLQELMRGAENAIAALLAGGGAQLVVVDGPLRMGDAVDGPIVGAIKRFVRRYLEPSQDRLIGRLCAGQRTPVFALLDRDGTARGFSWYTRIAELRGPWHDHAGVLRCETRAAVGQDAAIALADRVTGLLPRFAGRPADPRTPQNLAPVAGLETWLRHRMGDARMLRRSLLTWLAGEVRGDGDG